MAVCVVAETRMIWMIFLACVPALVWRLHVWNEGWLFAQRVGMQGLGKTRTISSFIAGLTPAEGASIRRFTGTYSVLCLYKRAPQYTSVHVNQAAHNHL
jgi:hypothetical protein